MADQAMLPAIAVEVASSVHLLQHALTHSGPSTIVVCSSQDEFMLALLTELDSQHASEPDILSQTLGILAMSSHVTMVFVPDIAHLRAYLSSLATDRNLTKPTTERRSLIIYWILHQMRDPGNFHAQSLMRSCALAVDAANAQGWRLILAERLTQTHHEDFEELEDSHTGPWTENMPMIARTTRLGDETDSFTGRMVQIRRVIGRWCRFAKLEELI